MRELFGRELWWTLNLVVCRVGGILMTFLRRMEWDYGRLLGGVESSSPAILDLRYEIIPRLVSDMICGRGSLSLRKPF
jgi:hypothetical protein